MPRRTIPARPALVTDIMPVLQRRKDHAVPIRQWIMEGRLPKGLYGFLDALRGCAERDLLTWDDHYPGRAGRAILLTPTGREWKPREDGTPVPLVYSWVHQGKPVLGTLEDWARTWATYEEFVPGGGLSLSLAGEKFNCYVTHMHPVEEGWRVVAAGEQVIVPKIASKEVPEWVAS